MHRFFTEMLLVSTKVSSFSQAISYPLLTIQERQVIRTTLSKSATFRCRDGPFTLLLREGISFLDILIPAGRYRSLQSGHLI